MNSIPLFTIIPLACAFLIALAGKKIKGLPGFLSSMGIFTLAGLSVSSLFWFNESKVLVYKVGGWLPPVGIALVLDGLSAFMLVTVNIVAFLIVVFSLDYMRRFTAQGKFYTLFMLMVAGMNGVIISGDMFNLFVFLEIAAISSYSLVAFGIEQEELEASFKYIVMGEMASLFILLGIALLYSKTSTLNMADMGRVLSLQQGGKLLPFVSVLFLAGFGIKSAMMPFHAWLPDAHPSAPAPISAMLSGVLIKSLGVYALCRIFYNVLGINPAISSTLMFLGVLSMVLGVLLAVGQWDFKRLLAYHSISQIGYIMLGIGLGTPLGILGGLFHLFNHSVFKSLLFLNSGAVEYATGTRDLRGMSGLSAKMPWTASTNMIAAMSISGIPPFNGFWSKLLIITAAVQAGKLGYAFWAVLASILTLASFMKLSKYAFFGALKETLKQVKEAPVFMKLAMVPLAVICLAGGMFFFSPFKELLLQKAVDVLLQGKDYAAVVLKGM